MKLDLHRGFSLVWLFKVIGTRFDWSTVVFNQLSLWKTYIYLQTHHCRVHNRWKSHCFEVMMFLKWMIKLSKILLTLKLIAASSALCFFFNTTIFLKFCLQFCNHTNHIFSIIQCKKREFTRHEVALEKPGFFWNRWNKMELSVLFLVKINGNGNNKNNTLTINWISQWTFH